MYRDRQEGIDFLKKFIGCHVAMVQPLFEASFPGRLGNRLPGVGYFWEMGEAQYKMRFYHTHIHIRFTKDKVLTDVR